MQQAMGSMVTHFRRAVTLRLAGVSPPTEQTLPDTGRAVEEPGTCASGPVHYDRSAVEWRVAMPKAEWISRVERVEKPWGFETHFALVSGKYCGKTLHVDAGHALSLQYHVRKEETIAVQSGKLLFEVGTADGPLESFELLPGEAVHLSPGTRHRMTALVDTVVLEASTTELDDVVRIEDRYGRER
jgi:mannose-6-phosphate isomerase